MPLRTILAVDGVVVGTVLAGLLVWKLRDILLLVLLAGFVALLLDPPVALLCRWGIRRGVAATVVFAVFLGAFAGLVSLFGIPLETGLQHFAKQLPGLVSQAAHGRGRFGHLIDRFHLQRWVQQHASTLSDLAKSLSKPALAVGAAALSTVFELLTVAVLSFFLLLEATAVRNGLLGLLSAPRARRVERVASEMAGSVTRYMAGKLVTSVVTGLVVYVAFVVGGVPFALLFGLWAGLFDLLPLIGGALGLIPAGAFAFVHSTDAGIGCTVAFVVYWIVENHVLNPVVMSRTVKLNPLLVLLAVLVGARLGGLFASALGGLAGALMAIPAAGALQVLAREVWRGSGAARNGEGPAGESMPAGAPPGEAGAAFGA